MRRTPTVLAGLLPLLSGCTGLQSALDPAGPDASEIARLSWILFIGAAVIFLLVLLFTVLAMTGPARWRRGLAGSGLIIGGGIVFPVVTLTALLTYGLLLTGSNAIGSGERPLRVEVIGEQFWWRVRYSGGEGDVALTTANEIRIPVGRPVELSLASADVIHSFWVPSLAGKLDMIPGRVNRMVFTAAKPGVFRGQCAEYCGAQHAKMAFYVVAHEAAEFDRWMADQAEPAREPAIPMLVRGKALFQTAGCGACHTIRGTEAAGVLGPDLTHVGGRLSLAAGMLPNNVGTLAGWIASAQHIKPGNRMPSFDVFTGEELRSIAAYLESLK